MDVKITLNGKMITDSVDADMVLLDFCRKHNCYTVKRGCESGNCGLCTVLLDESRSFLAVHRLDVLTDAE